MKKVYVTVYSSASAAGLDSEDAINNIAKKNDFITIPDKNDIFQLPYFKINEDLGFSNKSRCSQIALNLLYQIEDFFVDSDPVSLFLATSTGGIKETEDVYTGLINEEKNAKLKYPLFKKHFFNVISDDIKKQYKKNIKDVFTLSTACSSSGQSLLQAYKFIKSGIIDRALIIGVDSLSLTTLAGFDSLKLVSHTRTMPLSEERDGLSLGEGGGIILLEAEPGDDPLFELVGGFSTTDGYHISSPDPEGTQQKRCIKEAVKSAGIDFEQIDYINAHGTGTVMNDQVEMKVIKNLFAKGTIVTSTKSFIGHTLGASAITELGITFEMLTNNIIYQKMDPFTPIDNDFIPNGDIKKDVKYFLKNSFGFGGNNVSLVFKKL